MKFLAILGTMAVFLTTAHAACSTIHVTAALFCRCSADPTLSCATRFPSTQHDALRAICATHTTTTSTQHIEDAEDCLDQLSTEVRMAYEEVVSSRGWTSQTLRLPKPSHFYRMVEGEGFKGMDHVDAASIKRSRLVRYNDMNV